jgi:hypothetical protein
VCKSLQQQLDFAKSVLVLCDDPVGGYPKIDPRDDLHLPQITQDKHTFRKIKLLLQ